MCGGVCGESLGSRAIKKGNKFYWHESKQMVVKKFGRNARLLASR